MVSSPSRRSQALPLTRSPSQKNAVVLGGGESPGSRRSNQVNAQLRAISLEYNYAELATATANWHRSRKLGAGCYGAVYCGEMKDGTDVAIKVIDLGVLMGKGESPEDAGFEEEVVMLSKFRHPNLVTLLGWGQQGLARYLVYEFLAGGDVFQRLHRSRSHGGEKTFHWYQRLSTLQDAATGLSHMHNSTPKAFHRDIKSANILLDRHGTAKMADFGLSCISTQTGANHITVKTISGTPGYKCPLYERTGRFTEGSEVYSFGMVMLEVTTGLDPSASDLSVPGGIRYPIAEVISPNKSGALDRCTSRLDVSANWPEALGRELCVLGLRSVNMYAESQRPLFVEIVRTLRTLNEQFPRQVAAPQPPAPSSNASSSPTPPTGERARSTQQASVSPPPPATPEMPDSGAACSPHAASPKPPAGGPASTPAPLPAPAPAPAPAVARTPPTPTPAPGSSLSPSPSPPEPSSATEATAVAQVAATLTPQMPALVGQAGERTATAAAAVAGGGAAAESAASPAQASQKSGGAAGYQADDAQSRTFVASLGGAAGSLAASSSGRGLRQQAPSPIPEGDLCEPQGPTSASRTSYDETGHCEDRILRHSETLGADRLGSTAAAIQSTSAPLQTRQGRSVAGFEATHHGHGGASPDTNAAMYYLELVQRASPATEALPSNLRRLPLQPVGPTTIERSPGCYTMSIGRFQQTQLFEAWLPDNSQRGCISRKAMEITWTAGTDSVVLQGFCTNTLSVDGKAVVKGAWTALRPGSVILFEYERTVLLELRFMSNQPVNTGGPRKETGGSAVTASTSTGSHGTSSIPSGNPIVPGTSTPPQARLVPVKSMAPEATTMGSESSTPWCSARSIQLDDFSLTTPVAGLVLEGVTSVNEAVEALNAGTKAAPNSGYCIVYSVNKAAYFLLFRQGKKEQALEDLAASRSSSPSKGRVSTGGKETRSPPKTGGQQSQAATTTLEPSSSAAGGYQSALKSLTIREQGWFLRCIHAEGIAPEQLASMPVELRNLPLVNGSNVVGRYHQPTMFENWLPNQNVRLVSRNHIQIVPSPDALTVTNLSNNQLHVDESILNKDETRKVRAGQVLSFSKMEGTAEFVHFLRLEVCFDTVPAELANFQPKSRVSFGNSQTVPKAPPQVTTPNLAQAASNSSGGGKCSQSQSGSKSPSNGSARPAGPGLDVTRTASKSATYLPSRAFIGSGQSSHSPSAATRATQARSPMGRRLGGSPGASSPTSGYRAERRSGGPSPASSAIAAQSGFQSPLNGAFHTPTASRTPKAFGNGSARERSPLLHHSSKGVPYRLDVVASATPSATSAAPNSSLISTLPAALKVVLPKENAMTFVGPLRQQELFLKVLGKELLEGATDDAFCITRRDSIYYLALTGTGSFRVLHKSTDHRSTELAHGEVKVLEDDDEITVSRRHGPPSTVGHHHGSLGFRFRTEKGIIASASASACGGGSSSSSAAFGLQESRWQNTNHSST